MKHDPGFTIAPARYSKNNMAVRCESDGSVFKTRAMRLASALPSRYSHRERAYIMSKRATERLQKLFDEGADANIMTHEISVPVSH